MRIRVYEGTIDPADLKPLLRMLREAGVTVELMDGLPSEECPSDAQIVVILYPDGHPYYDAMNSALSVGARGCHFTGVWPQNAESGRTPGRFGHLGRGGTSPWESDTLRRVLQSKEPLWFRPDGTHRDDPDEKHHQCNQA